MKVEKYRITVRVVCGNGIRVFGLMMMMLIGGIFLTHQTFGQNDSPPVEPSRLEAASDGGTAVRIMWIDNSDNETGFVVERKTGTRGTWAEVLPEPLPANTSDWRDQNSANLHNTPYIYRVKAVNGSGSSSWTNEAGAVTPPSGTMQCATVNSRTTNIPPVSPAPPLPLKHQVIRNDLSYLPMMRLTDESDGFFNTVPYSYWTTFNSNNTRIFIINNSGQGFLYQMDPHNFTITGSRTLLIDPTLEAEGLTWSKTNPNVVYATTKPTYSSTGQIIASGQLRQHNVTLPTPATATTNIRRDDFTPLELRGGVLTQMSVSEDNDNTFAWELKNACPTATASCDENLRGSYYFTWTRTGDPDDLGTIKMGLFIQNRFVPEPKPHYENDYNEVHINKNGNYLLRALDAPERRELLDLTTATPTAQPIIYLSHFDLGRNFLVGSDNSGLAQTQIGETGIFPRIRKVGFTTPAEKTLLLTYKDWRQDSYFSLLADTANEPWVLVSQYQKDPDPSPTVENIYQEIFWLSTSGDHDINGNPSVKRLAHHYSVNWNNNNSCTSEGGGTNCYRSRVHANISRDGKFIAFASSWGVFNGRIDVFILKTSDCGATAATVAVGGRVVDHLGSSISNARLTLVDSTGQTRLALTSSLGYYNFEEVPVGSTIVSVFSREHTFGQPSQVVNVTNNVTNINFTALEPMNR